MNRAIILILWCCLCCCYGCKKTCTYSEVPTLKYLDFVKIPTANGIDDKGVLKFGFTDADGDIGYTANDHPSDSTDEYYYNFFIDYYEKQNGDYVKVETGLPQNARLPVFSNNEPECMSGEISIEVYINNPFSLFDTIRFECYIVDRALHKSNKVTTPDIIVRKKHL